MTPVAHIVYLSVISVQKKAEHSEDSDIEADSSVDDRSQMLSDTHDDVKLRRCGFCGIEVCTTGTGDQLTDILSRFIPR